MVYFFIHPFILLPNPKNSTMHLSPTTTLTLPLLLTTLLTISTLINADIEADEIPFQCQNVCAPVVSRSSECDKNTADDHAEKQCMCEMEGAEGVLPRCEACIGRFYGEVGGRGPHDNGIFLTLSERYVWVGANQ